MRAARIHLDGDAAAHIATVMDAAGSDAATAAASARAAFAELLDTTRACPALVAALSAFEHARAGHGAAIGEHLGEAGQSVTTVLAMFERADSELGHAAEIGA